MCANAITATKSGRWVRQGGRILVLPCACGCSSAASGAPEREAGSGSGGSGGGGTPLRILIFYGYSGAHGDGSVERDTSHLRVAETLKEHLARRFPKDRIELVCAWHKNVFVKKLLNAPADGSKIRQIHYVGHGAGGGLYFGYHHPVAAKDRADLSARFTAPSNPLSVLPARMKRTVALVHDAGLMSGFFTDVLAPTLLTRIRDQLAPGALMQVWGCFAGAPTHTFDTGDAYWNLFNAAGAPVHGIARDIARGLGISVTAVFDPKTIHGMNYFFRDAKGKFHTSKRPGRTPQWLWPSSKSVRWITFDATGTGDEKKIRFLDKTLAPTAIPPGAPPKWLTGEIPLARAGSKVSAFPACSAARVDL